MVLVVSMNSSAIRWVKDPLPPDPMEMVPGLAAAALTRALTSWASNLGLTKRYMGDRPSSVIGAKSFFASYFTRSLYSAGTMVNGTSANSRV
ncbi:hypothetical protein D3C85_1387070 [compost metagenome]